MVQTWKAVVAVAAVVTNCKNPPKMTLKIIREIDGSYFHSLTNFKYDAHVMTGNGNQVNLLKLDLRNS